MKTEIGGPTGQGKPIGSDRVKLDKHERGHMSQADRLTRVHPTRLPRVLTRLASKGPDPLITLSIRMLSSSCLLFKIKEKGQ